MSGRTILCRRRNQQVANERGTQRGLTPLMEGVPWVGRAQTRSIEAKAEALRRVGCYCRCPAKRCSDPIGNERDRSAEPWQLKDRASPVCAETHLAIGRRPYQSPKAVCLDRDAASSKARRIALEGKHGPPRSHATWASPLRAARVRRHSASPDGLCCPPSHGVRSQSESPRQPAIASVGGSRFRW